MAWDGIRLCTAGLGILTWIDMTLEAICTSSRCFRCLHLVLVFMNVTHACRYLTWDAATFPHPQKMQEDIASRGRKMVTIVDPHIKRDPAYGVFKTAQDKGFYVKNKDGSDYDGCVGKQLTGNQWNCSTGRAGRHGPSAGHRRQSLARL